MSILASITLYFVLSGLVTPLMGACIHFGVRDEPPASEPRLTKPSHVRRLGPVEVIAAI
jgi:hypothetical protein